VKKTATSPEVERKVDAAMQRVGQAVADLLETTKQDKTVPEVSKKIEQQSEQISSNVHELLTAVKALPNTENIAVEPKPATLPSDLDAITEQELAKAARAIADATQQLLASKPLALTLLDLMELSLAHVSRSDRFPRRRLASSTNTTLKLLYTTLPLLSPLLPEASSASRLLPKRSVCAWFRRAHMVFHFPISLIALPKRIWFR